MRLVLTAVALLSLISPAYAQLAVPNEAGLTYGHVHLNVSDVELHKQLWVEHFGGVVTQKGSLVAVRLPNFLVALSEREPTGPSQGSVMDHFGFKVRNMAKFLAKWRAAGREVDSEFTGAEGLPNAYVTMPDGARVELQEDQGLSWEVSGYHIHFFTPRNSSTGMLTRNSTRQHPDDDQHEYELWQRERRAIARAGDRSHRVRTR